MGWIEDGESTQGGWGKEQLGVIGVDWPPDKGWKRSVLGWAPSGQRIQKFLELKDKHLPERKRRKRNRAWREQRRRRPSREFKYLLAYHRKRTKHCDLTADFLRHLWRAQEGQCAYCECELRIETRVLEHMQPLSRGGGNTQDNVCWACWDCNGRKSTQTYEQFMASER